METITTTPSTTTTDIELLASLGWQIPVEAVLRSYRGRPGCGCGCRGTYSTTKRAVTMRTKFINELIGHEHLNMSDVWSAYGDNGEDVVCVSWEDDETAVWLYVDASCLPRS
jgi:hypothetical protein